MHMQIEHLAAQTDLVCAPANDASARAWTIKVFTFPGVYIYVCARQWKEESRLKGISGSGEISRHFALGRAQRA